MTFSVGSGFDTEVHQQVPVHKTQAARVKVIRFISALVTSPKCDMVLPKKLNDDVFSEYMGPFGMQLE